MSNPGRRGFLKFLAVGSGVLAAGGIVNRMPALIADQPKRVSLKKTASFAGFRVFENKKEITFSSKNGDELVTIEKNA